MERKNQNLIRNLIKRMLAWKIASKNSFPLPKNYSDTKKQLLNELNFKHKILTSSADLE